MSQRENLLIIADSETDADLYHATKFFVTVTVIYLETAGKKILFLNDLEYGRGRAEARVDEIVSTTPYEEKLRAQKEPVRLTSVLDLYLKEHEIRELTVPSSFPFGHAERLKEKGYSLKLRDDPFFPVRTVKTAEEIRAIEETQRHAEAATDLAVSILRRSEIRGDWLHFEGQALTAEKLRLEIHKLLLELECHASNTIVAGGDQGADPHHRGSGPLPAHKTIILDIFPQSMRSRYWGDMTRTVVRGKASPAVKKLYQDVLAAQQLAFSLIKDGVDGQVVHEAVATLFKERGKDRKSTRLNSSHSDRSRMPSSA